jgi:hypothetical protein
MGAIRSSVAGIFLGVLFLCGGGVSEAADWALYYEDGAEIHHYDKASVTRPRSGIVDVSIRVTLLGSQEGKIQHLELSCKNHMFRELSDTIDPITGVRLPENSADGYKWTWFPMKSQIMSLYENLCE